jgi:aryl-alcohol dehydrogenase-like predicted oxidoreductase
MLFSLNGMSVGPLSLGGAGIGSCDENVFFQGPVSETQAIETILFSLENGINLIDTSPFYGNSEYKIGLALKELNDRQSVILSTKAGTHPVYKGYHADKILRSIENSLKVLNTDYLDILHVHDPSAEDLDVFLGKNGGMDVLLRLKEEGVILNIGLGVRSHDLHLRFISSGYADVIMPYFDYNLLRTNAAPLLQTAYNKYVPVMMGSALCMGLLSGEDPANCKVSHYDISQENLLNKATLVYKWCHDNGVDILTLNYKFILENPAVNTIVIGASSKEDVVRSLQALKEDIPTSIFNSFKETFILQ